VSRSNFYRAVRNYLPASVNSRFSSSMLTLYFIALIGMRFSCQLISDTSELASPPVAYIMEKQNE
jgi:hypothetical protein